MCAYVTENNARGRSDVHTHDVGTKAHEDHWGLGGSGQG